MSLKFKRVLLALAVVGAVNSASAFSPLGPYEGYQVARIGYNMFGTDIGGPMNIDEEYRWNVKTITYGFDESFLTYFGTKGKAAVEQAIAVLNALPAASQMSSNLTEFPLDAKRVNYQASALGLLDMKSYTLSYLLEEMGLASPERYTWTLRDRRVINNVVWYLVIKRNFDPITWTPSSYVNGSLYTYTVQEFTQPTYADAVESPADPLAFTHTAVVSGVEGINGGILGSGEFFTGLTRDDAAGLRYLYRPANYNTENLLADATASGAGGCPWCIPGGGTGTNGITTNGVVGIAPRPGVDKIVFQEGQYDSLLSSFIITTNIYTDTYVSNSVPKTQSVQRIITRPDILFAASDIGLDAFGNPILSTRTDTTGWANNDAVNGQTVLAGPGVIQPQIVITFNKLGPYLYNYDPPGAAAFLDEVGASSGFVWGWFDGTTNAPVVFPDGSSIQELEQQVLSRP